jgi:hypothetical protein
MKIINLIVSDGENSHRFAKVAENADEALASSIDGWDPFLWTKEEQEDFFSKDRYVGRR